MSSKNFSVYFHIRIDRKIMVTKRIKGDATLNFFTSIQFVEVRKREEKKY